jgi:hypothetical protein
VSNYRFKFPELYQFFGGYFYQGWTGDYRWETGKPDFSAVVRHFKAVNPPATVNRVRIELEELISHALDEEQLTGALMELGNNFYPPVQNLSYSEWLQAILEILAESPTKARVLRELR